MKRVVSSYIRKKARDILTDNLTVVISTPHSYYESHEIHDDMSLDFADMIAKYSASMGALVRLFPADMLRKDMDLNRLRSRSTDYRKRLEKTMLEMSPEDVYLDVHSARTCDFDYPFEVVFLEIENHNNFVFNLNKYLRVCGINSYIIEGTYDNDIVLMARNGHGLDKSTLIEINRDLSDKRMAEIAQTIAEYISGYMDNKLKRIEDMPIEI